MNRSLKKILGRSAIAAALLLSALAAWGLWSSWSASSRLKSHLDAIRAAGDPTSIAHFGEPERARPDDADALLEAAEPGVTALEAELTKLYPKSGRPEGSLDADALAALEGAFNAHPDVVPRLIEAASRPEYSHRFGSTSRTTGFISEVGDRTGRFRAMIRVLASWSAVLRARGDRDDAAAVGVAMLRLSDLLGRDPGFMSALAAIACGSVSLRDVAETLRSGPVSDDARHALDSQLARFDGTALLRHALATERAFSITAVREFPGATIPFAGWLRDSGLLAILELYEKELATVDLPYRAARDASRATVAGLPLHPWRPLATLLAPAMRSAREAVVRQTAMVRALRVVNALQGLDVDEPPGDLTTLSLPAEATVDPFAEAPLMVKKLPEGWLVYSVGADLVDDGGILTRVRDVGFGPPSKEEPAATSGEEAAGAKAGEPS